MKHGVAAVLALLVAGCAAETTGPTSLTERTTIAACREQANTAYALQNRDQIYRNYEPYAPQSSIGLSENPTRGLSDTFAMQQMVQNCIRNTGPGSARGVNATPVPAPSPIPGPGSFTR